MKMMSLAENMDKVAVGKGEPYYPSLHLSGDKIPKALNKMGAKGKI